jgi:hypothetical protein
MGCWEKCVMCCCRMKYCVDVCQFHMVSFNARVSLLIFFVWMTYLLVVLVVLKSPITTVLWSVCVFKSTSVCLTKLGTPTLGAYKLLIVISSCCIAPLIIMNWPSLSLMTDLDLKSIWYKYFYSCLFWGDICWLNLLLSFHLKGNICFCT